MTLNSNTAFNKDIQENYYNKIKNIFDKDGLVQYSTLISKCFV